MQVFYDEAVWLMTIAVCPDDLAEESAISCPFILPDIDFWRKS